MTGRFLVWLVIRHPFAALVLSGGMRRPAGDVVADAAAKRLAGGDDREVTR